MAANDASGQQSIAGVSFLMLTQVFTKLSTFLLNQLLIRLISPQVFGVATYLEFLLSTVLFFSREGERLSIQRTKNVVDEKKSSNSFESGTRRGVLQSIINFGYLPLMIGIPITGLVFYLQNKTETFQVTLYSLDFSAYILTFVVLLILLELVLEPIYAINQFNLNFKRRSKFESTAVTLRCLVTFSVVFFGKRYSTLKAFEGLAVLAFALGQFAYSLALFVLYQSSFFQDNEQNNSLFISKIHSTEGEYYYLDKEVFKIWLNIFIQMIFKHFLTEGDKLVINYLCTITEQGVYSVMTNYGSIIARLLLQPIEESLRLLFTKLFINKSNDSIKKSHEIMTYLSIFYLNFSVLICLGGFTNASYLLRFLIGGRLSNWNDSNIFEIFPHYILYIPFMAFNGILEAFFSSCANEHDINKFSFFMSILALTVFAALYFFISYLEMGISGLILANIVNMTLRILYCLTFIKKFYLENNIKISSLNVFHKLLGSVILGLSAQSIQWIVLGKKWYSETFNDLIKSATVCFLCLVVMLVQERALLKEPLAMIKGKFKKD